MKQKHVKMVAIAISAMMLLSILAGILSPVFAYENELEQAQAELEEIERQAAAIEAELDQLAISKSNTYAQIEALDRQIETVNSQINATMKVIEELAEDIEVQEQLLAEAIVQLNEQYELFKTRMRVMYENGDASYLEILLSSSNFFDMLSNIEITNQIMQYDQDLFDSYTENAKQVEAAKLKLEEDKAEEEEQKASLDAQYQTLSASQAQSEKILSNLIAEEAEAEEMLLDAKAAEDEMIELVAELAKKLAGTDKYVGGELAWPLSLSYTSVSSPFGYRTHPVTGQAYSFHSGIDLPAPSGTEIKAANAGEIIVSTYSSGYGNYVMVDHGGGIVTLYAHMSKRNANVGDVVVKNQVIGYVGTTGMSTGNHLHFEVIVDGNHIDPMSYFS